MFVPRDRNDEKKVLTRFGNDILRMPDYYRMFFRLTLRQRHDWLKKWAGKCWDMPCEGSKKCPLCNTGVKMKQNSLTSSSMEIK